MRANTKKRKKATVMLKATQEQEWWADQVVQVMLHGKRALDAAMLDVGRLVAETLMYMEREERRLNRTVDAERLAHNLARYEGSTACCADPTDAYPPVMPKSPFAQKR